jgi:16S rRNA (uracil1498-N3)-methyltransferase
MCTVEGAAARHIARVLRLSAGDALILFDGAGGEYTARIEAIGKGTVQVAVLERQLVDRESPLSLTLAQGVPRGERMDWVVQKATELGVSRLVPVLSEHSLVRLDPKQAQSKQRHWQGVAVAACEQSGRDRIPQVASPATLAQFLLGLSPGGTRLLLSPEGAATLESLPPPAGDLIVLIGPEGGLSEEEQRAARGQGFTALRLGPRVLRTETAAVATLALLQHRFGDL